MLNTFLQILPLALGGAVNPFGIIIIFFILASKEKPLKRAWLFILGSTLFLMIVVGVEHILLRYTLDISRHQNNNSSIIDIVLGILLILLAIFRKKKQKTKTKKTSNMWQELIAGFFFMAVDLTTLVLFFSLVKIVFDAKLPLGQDIIIFLVSIIITMSTMALPPFLATVFPNKSANILKALNQFVTKRGDLISKIVILVIGLYLIYKGVIVFI